MNVNECITTRRSIRKYKPDPVDHSLIESIVSMASYSPSWKNTQITRYIAIDDSSILKKIADDCTPVYNSNIIQQSRIMGIFDEDKITELLEIPEERELAALIAVGWPDIDPEVPKRKSVDDLLQFR